MKDHRFESAYTGYPWTECTLQFPRMQVVGPWKKCGVNADGCWPSLRI